jgi:thiol:disulfide interchange protein DsbC
MKKLGVVSSAIIIMIAIAVLGFGFLNQSLAGNGNVCDKVNLTEHLPVPASFYTVVDKKEAHGLCQMILKMKSHRGERLISVYATKDFVIAGEMFVNKHQSAAEKINSIKNKQFKKKFSLFKGELEQVAVAPYRPEKANKKVLYYVTDPLCPYCEMGKKQLKNLADKYHYTVKLVWFPVHGPKSKEKIASFVCNKKTFNDYLSGDYGTDTWTETCPEGRKFVEDSKILAQKLGVNGAPVFITSDGEMVVGANIKKVRDILK